ncbi:hypothetical protein GCM10008986_27550 [Salinibacillus aidingensis]|uniref:AMP-dependent synthetase/ligase domain-containing protein n=1 Tax=Salinibacillus aidingensis TaxID=237684 RepID=A0ABN1BIX7_9BACI
MQHKNFYTNALKSSFYQTKFANENPMSWDNLPVTTKEELREVEPLDLLGTDFSQVATYHETSGTTGTPTPSWYSHNDVEKEAETIIRSELNLNEQDLVLTRLPFALAIPGFIMYWACQKTGAGHLAADKLLQITPDIRVIELMKRTEPTILCCLPSEAEKLYEVSRQAGAENPSPKLRALVLAGELISPARKAHFERLWGVPVYGLFGSTETGGLYTTCENGNYHMDREDVIIEIVNEHHEPLGEDKKGYCLISTKREGMPLVKYSNQDIVERKQSSSCGCGNSHPVLMHYGRRSDEIHYQGQTISLYELQEMVYTLTYVPVRWQVNVYKDRYEFVYQIVGDKREATRATIEEELQAKSDIPFQARTEELIDEKTLLDKPAWSKHSFINKYE